jgi:hypothetical protein
VILAVLITPSRRVNIERKMSFRSILFGIFFYKITSFNLPLFTS